MMRAENAIARFRRDLTLSSVLNSALLVMAMLALALEAFAQPGLINGTLLLAIVGVIWIVLLVRGVRDSRLAAISPSLIAAGEYEQAEHQIDQVLRSFTLFRGIKLRSLHHLAILRHAQRRWSEAVLLCQALLKQRLGALGPLARSTRLIMADAMLEVGDVRGAYGAIMGLYQQRLSLGEALELLLIQLEYMSRIGAWTRMVAGAQRKVAMAELMSTEKSARAQALLALAAKRTNQADRCRWLQRRVELLVDTRELVKQRPLLAELWPDASDEAVQPDAQLHAMAANTRG